MKREIKFRIWTEYRTNFAFDYLSPNNDWRGDEDKLQQYTGLKDKNGKEIYEGDIVNDEGAIWMVHFVDGCWLCGQDLLHDVDPKNYIEIIGNIHETPELL